MSIELKHRKKIASLAFEIFRAWTRKATKYYPDHDFTIVDEGALVDDLEETILKGISTLQRPEKTEKRKEEGFDYRFLVGYIQGSLDVKWIYDYVHRNTDLFRDFIACKAILEYLQFDTKIGTRINKLFNVLMKQDSNLAKIKVAINENITPKYQIDKISEENQYLEKSNPVYRYLENQLSKHLLEVMDSKRGEIMPRLDSFFDEDFIFELILSYEK